MSKAALDVVGIGNAIVDIIAHADDDLIRRLEMPKAAMTLIGMERARQLSSAMGPRVQRSGGSAGNTVAGLASLGAKAGYIGKVGDDELGDAFRRDLASVGVRFSMPPAAEGPETARCLIFVTPDAQHTMNTCLGACADLTIRDLDREMIQASEILYLEGYLFDSPHARDAIRMAAQLAHAAGRQVALTLSDPSCVRRHRRAFLDLVENDVDILFADEVELMALFATGDWNEAFAGIGAKVGFAALTRGSRGSLINTGGRIAAIPAAAPAAVVDRTGVGALFASGVLFGVVNGLGPEECGWLGSLAAAEVISHDGGRPQTPLKAYVASRATTMPATIRHAQIRRHR